MAKQKYALIVEDDESVLRSVRRALVTTLGYQVSSATDYVSGKELLDAHVYDLIISDNSMPISPTSEPFRNIGIQLLTYAREQSKHKEALLILYTADDTTKIISDLAKIGAHYLHKPTPDFADAIRKLQRE